MSKQLSPEELAKRRRINKRIMLFFFLPVLILIVVIISIPGDDAKEPQENTKKEATEKPDRSSHYDWKYSENTDNMTGKPWYYAKIQSTTFLDFEFPYKGGSEAYLHVRYKDGQNDVMLSIDPGQFMPGNNQYVRVRFDQEEPVTVGYNLPEDGSMDVIFLKQPQRIIEGIRGHRKITIEAPFYQEGRQQMEFFSDNFKWEH
ncbi:MAG: hypothetical protein K9I74_14645 [Bacteroidales bacterium]|nr:hypothetical protein [Bacteroidales bacterium]